MRKYTNKVASCFVAIIAAVSLTYVAVPAMAVTPDWGSAVPAGCYGNYANGDGYIVPCEK